MGILIFIFAGFAYIVAAVLLIGGGIMKSPAILNAMKIRYAKKVSMINKQPNPVSLQQCF